MTSRRRRVPFRRLLTCLVPYKGFVGRRGSLSLRMSMPPRSVAPEPARLIRHEVLVIEITTRTVIAQTQAPVRRRRSRPSRVASLKNAARRSVR
jgi:hypothetical protein